MRIHNRNEAFYPKKSSPSPARTVPQEFTRTRPFADVNPTPGGKLAPFASRETASQLSTYKPPLAQWTESSRQLMGTEKYGKPIDFSGLRHPDAGKFKLPRMPEFKLPTLKLPTRMPRLGGNAASLLAGLGLSLLPERRQEGDPTRIWDEAVAENNRKIFEDLASWLNPKRSRGVDPVAPPTPANEPVEINRTERLRIAATGDSRTVVQEFWGPITTPVFADPGGNDPNRLWLASFLARGSGGSPDAQQGISTGFSNNFYVTGGVPSVAVSVVATGEPLYDSQQQQQSDTRPAAIPWAEPELEPQPFPDIEPVLLDSEPQRIPTPVGSPYENPLLDLPPVALRERLPDLTPDALRDLFPSLSLDSYPELQSLALPEDIASAFPTPNRSSNPASAGNGSPDSSPRPNGQPAPTAQRSPNRRPALALPSGSPQVTRSPGVATLPSLAPANPPSPPSSPTPDRCKDPCTQKLQDSVDEGKATAISVQVFKACDTVKQEPIFETKTVSVPKSEVDSYKLLYDRIAKLEGLQCSESSAIAVVPEWWQARGNHKPQLVVLFGSEVRPGGKLTTSRWTLTIPHYNRPKTFKPNIPSYKRGNFEAILRLADSSRVIINCSSETECKRVMNAIKGLISKSKLTGSELKVGQRFGKRYKEVSVVPVSARFFSKGQENLAPDWILNLRK